MNSSKPTETKCPFCKTDLKPGATTCAACGATYTIPTANPLVGMVFIFGALLVVGGLIGLFLSWDIHALIPIATGSAFIWLVSKLLRYEWVKQ